MMGYHYGIVNGKDDWLACIRLAPPLSSSVSLPTANAGTWQTRRGARGHRECVSRRLPWFLPGPSPRRSFWCFRPPRRASAGGWITK